MKEILVMLLAGGKGERLYPLTRDRAKPAVPFGGIYRIIDFTLSNCLNSNLRRIIVLTQYKSISLNRHIQEGWDIFRRELQEFIDIIPAQQRVDDHWYRGTADAIYHNIYSIQQEKPKLVIILSGDHVYKMNYAEIINYHKEKGADVTVAALETKTEQAQGFGIIQVDQDNRIIGFEEKPKQPKMVPSKQGFSFASMGIYIFNTEVLVRTVIEDAKSDSKHDFGKNIIPSMINKHHIFAYNFQDNTSGEAKYWRDVGTIDAYYEANMDLVYSQPTFNIHEPNWPIRTFQGQYPPTKFVTSGTNSPGGTIIDSIVSAGCLIEDSHLEKSVLSPGIQVERGAEIRNSILMERATIGKNSKIKNTIIDKGISIPPDVEIGYDLENDARRFTVTPKGIVVVPKWLYL